MIHLALTHNDLILLAKTINNIAETYFIFGELKNAIFANTQLKWLCEITGLHKYKMYAFLNLAKCCKKLGRLTDSQIFFKKTLQYCWYYKENDLELDLYEELGLIHYNLGNLEKAKKYHDRCLANELESDGSISKQLGIKNIEKLLKESYFPLKIYEESFFERFPLLPFDFIRSTST